MAADPVGLQANPHVGPPIVEILEEHLAELGFLAIQRRKLLFSPDVPLRGLQRHDRRIEAHLDALVVGGLASDALVRAKLSDPDAWTVAAALRAWLEVARPAPAALFEVLAAVPVEALAGAREALRAISSAQLPALPESGIAALPAAMRALVADARGWHDRLDARGRAELRGGDAAERIALARHLGHARDVAASDPVLKECLDDPEPEVARRGLWSLALLDPADGVALARERARGPAPDPVALRVVGLWGVAGDLPLLAGACAREESRVAGLLALGDLGAIDALEALAPWLASDDEAAARAAATAVERLAGPLPELAAFERSRDLETLTPAAGPLIAAARAAAGRAPAGSRLLRGRATWAGPPEDEPLESLWRGAVRSRPAPSWLRREVPDGFFAGIDAIPALPGE